MKDIFKSINWFIKEHYKTYILLGIVLTFLSVFFVFPTKILGLVIDKTTDGSLKFVNLILYSFLLLIIPISRYLANIFYHYTINKLGQNLSFELRDRYIEHLFELDSSTYAKYTKGDLISRAINDLTQLTVVATSFLQSIVFNTGIVISAILIMIITINPLLTIASVIIMPISIFRLNKIRLKKRSYYKIHREVYADMTEKVLESIEGVKTIRAYVNEEYDYQKTSSAIKEDIRSWRYILKFEALFTPLFEFIYAFSYFVAFAYGSYLVIYSKITTGELVTFVMYIGTLYGPLIALSNVLNTINNATISHTRFQEIMDIKPIVYDTVDSINVLTFKKIEFIDVSFKYPFDEREVIKNINFEINNGEVIALVGPSGSGKSTIIRQLLREFNVSSGKILLDGVDIKDYKIDDVHNLVGYVPQSHILFQKTVDENILIGNPLATEDEIDIAITISDFKKDIKELSHGKNTLVGELGGSLSGGQRQRLSIARALIKNPEILILDDSLSAVDALTEKTIIDNLKEKRSGKTSIIIAHRFSSIYSADKILVIENGTITHSGTHKELTSYDNWYNRQYHEQLNEGKDL